MRKMLKLSPFQMFTREKIQGFAFIVMRKEQKRSRSGYLRSARLFWLSMLNNTLWRKTSLIIVGLQLVALFIIIKL